ncbi:hypothetical protein BDEG_20098 [Batrachochytrium dendrobatidis JEL423]|uniref:Velvet domain-containing protein n=1 Tax=Batrachochytrium dendrobatidis (strain JEL423) TaxID=403673 RepID=A0A177W7Y9_BATDL|nr:hypothetical protein BDEG_20098 [Batrachochytrium dendrobatidis JEL423]
MSDAVYELIPILQPERARSCGFSGRLNRRTIDPCIILQLGLRLPGTEQLVLEYVNRLILQMLCYVVTTVTNERLA